MMILFWFLLAIFVLVCVLLCFFVLIQSDKGGGISGAIGGGLGGAQSLLGTQDTANFLTRATVGLGVAFLILCILMSIIMSHQTYHVEKSLLQKRAEKQASFSPSSVLERGGLPIRQSGQGAAQGVAGGAASGLPQQKTAPAQAGGQPSSAAKGTQQSKSLPLGAIPIGPSSGGAKK